MGVLPAGIKGVGVLPAREIRLSGFWGIRFNKLVRRCISGRGGISESGARQAVAVYFRPKTLPVKRACGDGVFPTADSKRYAAAVFSAAALLLKSERGLMQAI